jgi:hypothetical protein
MVSCHWKNMVNVSMRGWELANEKAEVYLRKVQMRIAGRRVLEMVLGCFPGVLVCAIRRCRYGMIVWVSSLPLAGWGRY